MDMLTDQCRLMAVWLLRSISVLPVGPSVDCVSGTTIPGGWRAVRLIGVVLVFPGILTLTALSQTPMASTQEKPNFSGTWGVIATTFMRAGTTTDVTRAEAERARVLVGTLCGERCTIAQDGSTLKVTRDLPNGSLGFVGYLPGDVWTFVLDGGVEHHAVSSTEVATEARWVSGAIAIRITVVDTLQSGTRSLETKCVLSRTAAGMTVETTQTDTAGTFGPKPGTAEAVGVKTDYLKMAASTSAPFGAGGGLSVIRPGNGCTNPVLVRQVDPKYTSQAMRSKIEGDVGIETVVRANGTVGDMRVSRSLDTQFGLDDQALKAAKGWIFRPATCKGEPVNMIVTLYLQFRLH
jgi:TonB family protein